MAILRLSFTLLLILFSPLSAQAADNAPATCRQAPNFELRSLRGDPVSLVDFRGSVVLLNFWSTRCKPCLTELPSLNRLYLSLRGRGLQVLAVAVDSTESPVREFVSKNKIAFPVAVDREKEIFFDDYAGPSLPTTYLIDRAGVIVETFNGARAWDSEEMSNRIVKGLESRK